MSATTTGSTGTGVRRRVRIVVTILLTVAAVVIAVLAFFQPGHPFSRIEANNGGIWVFDTQEQRIGRVNVDARQVDAQLRVTDAADIMQAGPNVFLRTAAGVRRVNPATLRLEGEVRLGPAAKIAFGGDRIALTDDTGRLWILDGDELAAFDPERTPPMAPMDGGGSGEGMTPVVAANGDVYVLAGRSVHVYPRAERAAKTKDKRQIEMKGVSGGKDLAMSLVGETPVVLNATEKRLYIGKKVEVDLVKAGISDAEHAVVQLPSAEADAVAVATPDAVYLVPLDGGKAQPLPTQGSGTPARPVQLDGCVYGAWSGSQTYLVSCGSKDPVADRIPHAPGDSQLELRTDHGLVVLNDRASGASWLIANRMSPVSWDAPPTPADQALGPPARHRTVGGGAPADSCFTSFTIDLAGTSKERHP